MKMTFAKYIVLLLSIAFLSCSDDLSEYGYNEEDEGMKVFVDLETCFYPNAVASLNTRAVPGNSIDEINNLFVGFYSTDGTKALKFFYYYDTSTGLIITPLSERETGGDDNDPICKGTVNKVEIPTGKYHIIAVANMGNLNESHNTEIQTLAGVQSISLPWKTDIKSNNQMSGFFNTEDYANPPHTGDTPPEVQVTGRTHKLHAWLRRAASKVTVSFNGDSLNQNVWVYIRSIKLKDIPSSCPLVNQNTPTETKELIAEGDSVAFGPYNDYSGYKSWPTITSGKNTYISDFIKKPHARDSEYSLFFFENMQGTGKSKHQVMPDAKDKSKPTYPTGYIPTDPNWKDTMKCGTYVEIEGFYESQAGGNHAKGKIIYRFMLGKDVDNDYNAERNYHYKLTLKFKGNANDVDWHIEYKEDDGYWAPSPYYISYLYNKSMYLPIQTQGRIARIDAKIIENNWYPSGETEKEQKALNDYNKTLDEWGGYPVYWGGGWSYTSSVKRDSEEENDCCFGFLSLKYEGKRSIEMIYNEFNQDGGTAEDGAKFIDKLYHDNELYKRSYYNHLLSNDYYTKWKEDSKDEEYHGIYYVEDETLNENPRHVFMIPFYTRALNLVTSTSYTGNNPFFNYVRKAKVRIRAWDEDNKLVKAYDPTTGKRTNYIDVEFIQVRRIINPKAIFRHASNDEQFHVVLKERKGDINDKGTPTTYENTISHGAWAAKIIAGEDWIRIGKESNPTSTRNIYGDTETPIDFYVKPKGKLTDPTAQRHGIIEVSYNNNTCFHTIVVKQGYAPTQVIGGRESGTPQARWSNFNMRSKDEMCKSPLEEGSMFRPGKVDDPIHPNNNWGATVKSLKTTFNIYNKEPKKWKDIGKNTMSTSTECLFDNWTFKDSYGTYQVAELQDFYYLRNERLTAAVSNDIDISYGIVYGDGATECQDDVDLAHGYTFTTATNGGSYPTSKRGMRGCIVYNNGALVKSMAGNCVFFPSGVEGYGRRVNSGTSALGDAGRLRYSGGSWSMTAGNSPISSNMGYRPILHRLDLNMGMIYWHRRYMQTGFYGFNNKGYALYCSSSWDFNMTTFDFNSFFNNGNSDAAFVRMVLDTEKSKYKEKVVNTKKPETKCFPNYTH